MIQQLRAGTAYYTDTFGTGLVPTLNLTDSLIQEVFNMYYNPGLSVIGDEIVGLADIDSYGGIGDNIGSGSYFFNGPKGLLGNNSAQFLNTPPFSMYTWSSTCNSHSNPLQVTPTTQ